MRPAIRKKAHTSGQGEEGALIWEAGLMAVLWRK